jgi:hypothetical protein
LDSKNIIFIQPDSLILATIALIKISVAKFALGLAGDSVNRTSGFGKTKDKLSIFPFIARGTNDKYVYHFINSLPLLRDKKIVQYEPVVFVTLGDKNATQNVIKALQKFSNFVIIHITFNDGGYSFSVEKSFGVFCYAKELEKKDDKKHKLINSSEILMLAEHNYGETIDNLGLSIPGGYFYKYLPKPNDTNSNFTIKTVCGSFYFAPPSQEDDPFENDILKTDGLLLKAARLSSWLLKEYHMKISISKCLSYIKFREFSFNVDPLTKNKEMKLLDKRYGEFANEYKIKPSVGGFIGIYSSSLRPTNILLWSHYASGHQGICLRYSIIDFSQGLFNKVPDILAVLYGHVKYSSHRPLSSLLISQVAPFVDDVLLMWLIKVRIAFTKFKDWKYQDEYRFVLLANHPNSGEGFALDIKPKLAYLGCKANESEYRKFHELTDILNNQVKEDKSDYSLTIN